MARSAGNSSSPEAGSSSKRSAARTWLALVVILLVALSVRTIGLEFVPPGLFRDEAEKGYNAWSLATTGRDYEGRLLPLFINAYGSHTSAIYQYCTAPIVAVLGLDVWTTRLTAGLVGTLTVFLLFLLARVMFDDLTALVAAALLALSPWHIHFSRWAQQGIFLPLLFTLAAWGTVRFRRGWRPGLPIVAAAIALAAYAYAVGRVLAPLWLLLLFWVARKDCAKHKTLTVVSACVLFALVAPTAWFTFARSDQAMARFRNVSIARPGTGPQEIAGKFLLNYAKHFDPTYLFIRGDRQLRHSPRRVGQINPVEAPFLLFGLVFLFRRRNREAAWLILGWLLIAPVASSLTDPKETPHALRTLAGVPAFSLLAAFGLTETRRRLPDHAPRLPLTALLLCAELAVFGVFAYRYIRLYPEESSRAWQAGVIHALESGYWGTGKPAGEMWFSESIGGSDESIGVFVPPSGVVCPMEVYVAFHNRILPRAFQQSRLDGSPLRVVRAGSDLKLLLTGAKRLPISLITLRGEIPQNLAREMNLRGPRAGPGYDSFVLVTPEAKAR